MKKGLQKPQLEKIHEGKWVALAVGTNQIIGYATSLAQLEKKVGREGVFFTKALRSDVSYAF